MDRAHHLGEPVIVAAASPSDAAAWAQMRKELWPEGDSLEHLAAETAALLESPGDTLNLIAHYGGQPIGFAEASLRHDYVNGCETSPVAFLEAIYVRPAHRRRGVARELVEAVTVWARMKGCTEFASDAAIDNHTSQHMHLALGFTETERVVYFRRLLGGQ